MPNAETDASARKAAAANAPMFDPGQHLTAQGAPAGDDPMVRVELCCSCGGVRRQVDPVSYILRTVTDWRARHAGDGHEPASLADAIAEREARRESAHRAAGRPGDYEPSDYSDASTEVIAWPDLSTA